MSLRSGDSIASASRSVMPVDKDVGVSQASVTTPGVDIIPVAVLRFGTPT